MGRLGLVACCLMLLGLPIRPASAAEPAPSWAYPVNPPEFRPEADDGTLRHVPDSALAITLTQARDRYYAPDWHPEDHPAMPEVVAHGRKPDVFACGFCHRADGPGGPENAGLTGLSVAYIRAQMAAFRDGTRGTVEPKRLPFPLMAKIAAAATDAEVTEAAAYFASLPYRSVVDVVETDTVPRTRIADWHLLVVPGGGEEPIGARIIEIPADNDRFTSRDTRVRFTAFVPSGSIAKGRALATTGGDGRTVVCSTCHGADLKGAGMAPGIAGRSPSYIVRQLFDIREGKRSGANAALMRPTVQHLTLDDMIALTAYVASLRP